MINLDLVKEGRGGERGKRENVCVCCVCVLCAYVYHFHGYRRRKWTRRHEFKSWTTLIAFSHSTNTLGKGMNPIILPPAMGK